MVSLVPKCEGPGAPSVPERGFEGRLLKIIVRRRRVIFCKVRRGKIEVSQVPKTGAGAFVTRPQADIYSRKLPLGKFVFFVLLRIGIAISATEAWNISTLGIRAGSQSSGIQPGRSIVAATIKDDTETR